MAKNSLRQWQQTRPGRDVEDDDRPPPKKRRKEDPYHGHDAKSNPNDAVQAMRDAGVRWHHTLCMQCGKPADQLHRDKWRKCKGACPINPAHKHPFQPCPDIMRVATEEWCISRVNVPLAAERQAARDAERRRRAEQQQQERDARSGWQTSRSPNRYASDREAFGESYGGSREPGYQTGYTNNRYGEQIDPMQGIDHGLRNGRANSKYNLDGDRYTAFAGPSRMRDVRERSPRREQSRPHDGYRDRTPVSACSSSRFASSSPVARRDRHSSYSPPTMVPTTNSFTGVRSNEAAAIPQQEDMMPNQKAQSLIQPQITSEFFSQQRSRIDQLQEEWRRYKADILRESFRKLQIWRRDEAKRQQQAHKRCVAELQRDLAREGSRPVTATVVTYAYDQDVGLSTANANLAFSQPQGTRKPDGALRFSDVIAARNAVRRRNAQLGAWMP